jgi:acyl-CoA synthetase (AMP-forming)/AMP-acid ligase II
VGRVAADADVSTIAGALEHRALASPTVTGGADDTGSWTYRELWESAERVARSLVAAGVDPGDRVSIWAPNSIRWIVASFGVYLAGATLVPVNTRFKSGEAAHLVRTARAKVLLGTRDFLDQDFVAVAGSWADVPALESVVDMGDGAWASWLDRGDRVGREEVRGRTAALGPDSVSDIIFTSGTTGAPKGAVLTHGASVRTYRAATSASTRSSTPRG